MAQRDYEGEGITIHWNSDICQHSGICARGLASVFQPKERPWIKIENGTAQEISAVIDQCPSKALAYTLK
ncbi:(4Fe-4S)-binding protein [Deinococcus cellulosilyticus]|uniref:Divergent 4Fe-4S mono-cluster domain-containing protein n=1 Tax=Deinococcus cellulosilyticus (strain DSM 18568 / NBRC 106333 / KACC 11606 / 5516J-15) TaxID=1223518 RepID=A0A511MYW9_DEIC1|nr:(4Fe-4S)-binding protein [Deinococcus cellulosilyticus]GEM45347.1 hypothetical protein DC3_09820 [Deinococcus cellulosilyticus NBRC 106333 = KACC 11606]